MMKLWISNINSADAKLLADDWDSYLANVGCEIYIHATLDRMILEWSSSSSFTVHRILVFVNCAFVHVCDLSELEAAIKNITDDHVVVFDSDLGNVEVRTLGVKKENEHDNETSFEELKLRQMFGYETVWHLVGKFERNGSVYYEEQWVHDQSVIEATVAVWRRSEVTEIWQSEYMFKNGKIRYMVACGGNL